MLEIIEKLVPLIDGATQGAVWLIVGYFILTFLITACQLGAVVYFIRNLPAIVRSFKAPPQTVSFKEFMKDIKLSGTVDRDLLKTLMEEIANGSTYIYSSDIMAATEAVKNAREGKK